MDGRTKFVVRPSPDRRSINHP